MKVVLNELSLNYQYESKAHFLDHLSKLLDRRSKVPAFSENLFCSRDLPEYYVCNGVSFRDAVKDNPDLRRIVLGWLSKKGPFIDDVDDDSYAFFLEETDKEVTDKGLGQICSLHYKNSEGTALSFPNGGFDASEIAVVRISDCGSNETFTVNNWFDFENLKTLANKFESSPQSWGESFTRHQNNLNNIKLVEGCWEPIESHPFSLMGARKLCRILDILDEYVESLDELGSRTESSHELVEKYFTGEALITDESRSNKSKFREELTFRDPKDPKVQVFCPWHGKVKSPSQYRIHFEWPIKGRQKIRVFYIGPKITKT